MYLYPICPWYLWRLEERFSTLELGFWMVVSFCVGAGTEYITSVRATSAFNHCQLSSPWPGILNHPSSASQALGPQVSLPSPAVLHLNIELFIQNLTLITGWGDGPLSSAFSVQAGEHEFGLTAHIQKLAVWSQLYSTHTRGGGGGSLGSLGSQPGPLGEHQASERQVLLSQLQSLVLSTPHQTAHNHL